MPDWRNLRWLHWLLVSLSFWRADRV